MFRRKIGFFYINDPNWIGGMDYVINAVNALSFLNEKEQPDIEIIVSDDVNRDELAGRIKYLKYKFYVLPKSGANDFGKWLQNKIKWKFIYPFPKGRVYDKLFFGLNEKRKVFWIPDFQEEYFSYLFGEEVIEKRRQMRSALAIQNKSVVVFSSQNAQNDFFKFYGPKIHAKTKVLQFANPDRWDFKEEFVRQTLSKYKLESNKFFICPNQMWEHKNHVIVFQALREALKINKALQIVFCGKEQDPRNPNFVNNLKGSAMDLVEKGNVHFLGFLPKDEQMCLIKESIALIQPSKFEGWSTTIEDAISLCKQVIASSLSVNKEQLGKNGIYFQIDNKNELSEKLLSFNQEKNPLNMNNDARVRHFAESLIALKD